MSDNRSTEEMLADPRDWRGTKIEVGSPVIYGGPVGRSIQLVEGEVVSFSKTGRVNVKVIRRAYSKAWAGDKRTVHVGQDRLIVIKPDGLPPTTLPTWEEAIDKAKRDSEERDRNYETHDWPEPFVEQQQFGPRSSYYVGRRVQPPCARCGLQTFEGYRQACLTSSVGG